jgi:hypothetical protein
MTTPEYVTIKFGPEKSPYELHIAASSNAVKIELRQLFESLSADIAKRQAKDAAEQRKFAWAAAD